MDQMSKKNMLTIGFEPMILSFNRLIRVTRLTPGPSEHQICDKIYGAKPLSPIIIVDLWGGRF